MTRRPAVLSMSYRPMSHFFRQNFSQVTNPPVDPLREERVMSLKTRFKNLGNVLRHGRNLSRTSLCLKALCSTGMYQRLLRRLGVGTPRSTAPSDEDVRRATAGPEGRAGSHPRRRPKMPCAKAASISS
jgi:glutamate synthase (NADPH/NADH) large chain